MAQRKREREKEVDRENEKKDNRIRVKWSQVIDCGTLENSLENSLENGLKAKQIQKFKEKELKLKRKMC